MKTNAKKSNNNWSCILNQSLPFNVRITVNVGYEILCTQAIVREIIDKAQEATSVASGLKRCVKPNCPDNDDLLDQINKVLVIIGLFFFALAIITFVFCRWNPKINNTARLNLCICLFLAHLIFLVAVSHTENKVICSIIAGVLHYLFLSSFVWMLLESIQLFLLVRSLTKVRIIHREGLRPLYLLLIGYSIPVVVVGVSAGLFPRGYGDDKICWLKNDKGFKWTFLGPVCCILAVNVLLFGAILWNVRSTLVNMKSDVSQVKDTRIILFKAIVQFVILGCGWLLGFFPGTPLLSYLFIVLNSQQGTFIFIVHCLLNKEVRGEYMKLLPCCCGKRKPVISRKPSIPTLKSSSD
ncbi:adhesion G protein-coupled receptor E1-like [Amia ocellicauda]|uniref:adhesion G protein-coupled receptor E1-like n=1 Tax=Amia ocellicauda TaxID=2972642 RepID=UPI003464C8F8